MSLSLSLRRGPVLPARKSLTAIVALAAAALASVAVAVPARAATTQYRLILNPTANTEYDAVNAGGDILGTAPNGENVQPALYRAGSATPQLLGPPPGQQDETFFLQASGLNDTDQVVGQVNIFGTPLLWPDSTTPSSLAQVPGLAGTFRDESLNAISDNGVIVGEGIAGNVAEAPFEITGNVASRLPLLPGGDSADPLALNDSGVIVGAATTAGQDSEAVKWSGGTIQALPSLAGTEDSQALGVNAAGTVVGTAFTTGDFSQHAVMWANGTVTSLSTGSGDFVADAINSSGVVVGQGPARAGEGEDATDAYIYENGTATNLNTLVPAGSGVILESATGINDQGDIVGGAFVPDGPEFGYELVPVS